MHARRCQGCAAPLPEAETGDALRCRFCGLVHDPATRSPVVHVRQIRVAPTTSKRVVRWVSAIVVLSLIAALVPVIFGLYVGWRALNTVPTAVVSTTPARAAALTPPQLRDAASGNHALDAAPPAGGYGAIDPVTAVPWALAMAQAWASDARLERIDVTRLRPDGTVNAQDDGEALVRYRFRSPARIAALAEQARLSTTAKGNIGLFLVVQRGGVTAHVDASTGATARGDDPPPHPAVLPVAKLAALAPVETVLAGVPFLSGYMIHLADEGWVWYFSTLAGESKPRVRARDGAVWPYARGR